MKYKIVLFDADQTLFDFKKCEAFALKACLAELGLRSDDECIETYSKINEALWKKLERGEIEKSKLVTERFVQFCDALSFDCDALQLSKRYRENLADQAFLFEGAVDILDALGTEARLFLVTNGLKSVQTGRLERSGIGKYFEEIFISEEVGAEKPDVKFFDAVKSRIDNFEDKEAIIIGDSLTSDIKGGINAGIDTCWYNPEGKEAPRDMKITYIIKELSELKEII